MLQMKPEASSKLLKDLVLKHWASGHCEDYMDTRKLLNLITFYLPYFPLG